PDQLVDIYGRESNSSAHETSSYPNYLAYRAQTTTLSSLIAYSNFFAHLSIDGSSDLVVGEMVSDNYFNTLGIDPRSAACSPRRNQPASVHQPSPSSATGCGRTALPVRRT